MCICICLPLPCTEICMYMRGSYNGLFVILLAYVFVFLSSPGMVRYSFANTPRPRPTKMVVVRSPQEMYSDFLHMYIYIYVARFPSEICPDFIWKCDSAFESAAISFGLPAFLHCHEFPDFIGTPEFSRYPLFLNFMFFLQFLGTSNIFSHFSQISCLSRLPRNT